MRSHHAKAINDSAKHLKLLYLPYYSLDFNQIEKMWAKIKSVLIKLRVRNLSEIPRALELAFSKISVSNCIGWTRVNFCGIAVNQSS